MLKVEALARLGMSTGERHRLRPDRLGPGKDGGVGIWRGGGVGTRRLPVVLTGETR